MKLPCLFSFTVLAAVLALIARTSGQDVDNGDVTIDPGLALTAPDKFNWTVFAAISKKAPDNLQFSLGANRTNNAVFETWADDALTFPIKPNPAQPPQWADRNKPVQPHPVTQLQLRASMLHPAGSGLQPQAILGGSDEVVFRNKSGFDFLISHRLFYRQGLADAFAQGVNAQGFPSGVKLEFNPDAIEVKAVYHELKAPLTKQNCHWNYSSDGKAYGLVALHIMTKQIPNWTWATWEWAGNTPNQPNGNPGRSDWTGSHDAFGVTYQDAAGKPTHFQAPNSDLGVLYPSGTIAPELLQLFKSAGYSDEWLSEWSNYRLKGSQIDFTDTTGVPVLLGNSVTEAGFVQTSSCMTCHGSASFNSAGAPNPTTGFTLDGQSRNGPLNPGWFSDLDAFLPGQEFGPYRTTYYPIDFVWAVFRARSAAPAP